MIRVDSPSDVIVIEKNEENYSLFPVAEAISSWERKGYQPSLLYDPVWRAFPADVTDDKWKGRGNEFFKRKEYANAIRSYSAGIEAGGTENTSLLYLNRSAAYLMFGQNEKALSDALDHLALCGDVTSTKGLYRAARSLYNLRRFDEALSFALKLAEDAEAKEFQAKIRCRIEVCSSTYS
jgi:tetratricopeptide (TPR) repeat protein